MRTSHLLAQFRECPYLHFKQVNGMIREKKSADFLIGQATHSQVLEGPGAFKRADCFGGPINPQTGKPFGTDTKAFTEWAEAQGKPVLTDDRSRRSRSWPPAWP